MHSKVQAKPRGGSAETLQTKAKVKHEEQLYAVSFVLWNAQHFMTDLLTAVSERFSWLLESWSFYSGSVGVTAVGNIYTWYMCRVLAEEEETLQDTCWCHSVCALSHAGRRAGRWRQEEGGKKSLRSELRGYLSALCPWLWGRQDSGLLFIAVSSCQWHSLWHTHTHILQACSSPHTSSFWCFNSYNKRSQVVKRLVIHVSSVGTRQHPTDVRDFSCRR